MRFGEQRPTGRLISLTPLIDVVFILLVFFMLAASFLDWRSVDLNVSSGVSAATTAPQTILISLAADGSVAVGSVAVGSVAVGSVAVAQSALRSVISARLADNRERPVVIRAEPGVPLQRAIDTLDLVRTIGAANVSLSRKR